MRLILSATTFAATVVAAVLIGFGVPVGWLWIGSQLQAGKGATTVDFSVAMVVLFGIILTYVFLLYLAGIVMALLDRGPDHGPVPQGPRSPWMQGQTETRPGPRRQMINGVERIFVVTTVVVTLAFWAWFAFKAGSPLPNQ
jgi:hypothetical protein